MPLTFQEVEIQWLPDQERVMDTVRAALRKKWLMTSLLKAGDYSSTLGRFVAEDERLS